MMLLEASLRRLQSYADIPIDNNFGSEPDVERLLTPLRVAMAKLLAHSNTSAIVRPNTLRVAREKWINQKNLDSLTKREIRALCTDSAIATSHQFVAGLLTRGDLSKNRLWLESLIVQYLTDWRTMEKPEVLEHTLAVAVQEFTGRSNRILQCNPIASNLFSGSAADWIGTHFLNAPGPVNNVLATWGIAPESGLGQASLNCAVRIWTDYIIRTGSRLSVPEAVERFEYLTQTLLVSNFVGDSEAGQAISAMVLSGATDEDPAFADRIRAFALESPRFGDPRLPGNTGKWSFCDRKARDKVASWFSKQDLDFFFRVAMPERSDRQGRRVFWERYLHQVVDCVVLLSKADELRLRSRNTDRLEYGQTTGTENVSAFIMRFRGATDLLIIEFSRPNNALYVHDAVKFDRLVGNPRSRKTFNLDLELKHRGAFLNRLPHTSSWEYTVADFLRNYGIRPNS
jgi:hypothetical protein